MWWGFSRSYNRIQALCSVDASFMVLTLMLLFHERNAWMRA
ncbi:MAG: hypothetical protein MG2_0015 [uncultured Candidatus Poseidoniales archaeon]|nr:MAG: hypothetical protein MG2_0015 [uncultured Candidatus Poseidoniales archaeon]